jgi:hypothetical protein
VNLRHQHVSLWDVLTGIGVCWLDQHFRLAVVVVPSHRCLPVSKGRELATSSFLTAYGLAVAADLRVLTGDNRVLVTGFICVPRCALWMRVSADEQASGNPLGVRS